MQRPTLAVLLGLPCAVLVAWKLGGALGGGVLAGFTLGAAVAGFGLAWQAHVLRTRPQKAMAAMMHGFLAKLAVVLIGALAFRYIDQAARFVDYKTFLIAFVVSAMGLMLVGLPQALRTPRNPESDSLPGPSTPGAVASGGTPTP